MSATQVSSGIVFAALLVASCARERMVWLSNESTVALSNVVLYGAGFSESIGTLGPGSKDRLSVRPHGESGVRLAFDAAGRHFDVGEEDEYEGNGGDYVMFLVDAELQIVVRSKPATY